MKRRPVLLFTAILLLWAAGSAPALEMAPFRTVNRSPLALLYGLPPTGDAEMLAAGEIDAVLALDVASNFTENAAADEYLLLDGETHRLELSLRLGLGDNLELGVAIPWLRHDEGFLDRFIDDWHDTFNLPGGGRDVAPRDRLLFLYLRDGREELRLDAEAEGLGEIRLEAAWQLHHDEDSGQSLALHGSLKLPTGDEDRLLGSGGTDVALWLSGRDGGLLPSRRLTLYGGAGLLIMSEGGVLPQQQRHWAGFGTFGLGYAPWRPLALKVQLDGHTALFEKSALKELDRASVQLTFGGTVFIGKRTALDLGLTEDIVVHTSPDVVFHLALRRRF